ncbi:hypothetical protein H5410_034827 [Solanum commersonii]|uniref:Uncharacterized protein n=1 Tax=Solanum commersonii TaxID=4109 RepID=A0A9J5YSG7_SOLCO|nr:hypothetical protein H5410_034827 [Solanum commersonii]
MPNTQDNITTSGSSSVATEKSPLIDIHHPFFLHSSDAPGMTLRETFMAPTISPDSSSFMVGNMSSSRNGKQVQRYPPAAQKGKYYLSKDEQHTSSYQVSETKPEIQTKKSKFTHDKSYQGQVRENGVVLQDEVDGHTSMDLNFVQQHMSKDQFMDKFNQMKIGEASGNDGNSAINANAVAELSCIYTRSFIDEYNQKISHIIFINFFQAMTLVIVTNKRALSLKKKTDPISSNSELNHKAPMSTVNPGLLSSSRRHPLCDMLDAEGIEGGIDPESSVWITTFQTN